MGVRIEVEAKFPIFYELVIRDIDYDSMLDQLKNTPIGLQPTYVQIADITNHTLLSDVAHRFIDCVKTLEISPYFPAPIYIVIPQTIIIKNFPTVSSINELPNFYKKAMSQLTSKERSFLEKYQMLFTKVRNLLSTNKILNLKKDSNKTRELKTLIYTGMYYEKLINKLKIKQS